MSDSVSVQDHVPLWQGNGEWFLREPAMVTGRPLRYLLTGFMIEAGGPLSVQELIGLCERQGVVFRGRASKVISDSLRWDVRKGRVMRVRRGVYRASKAMMPRSTWSWMRKRIGQVRVYLATLRNQAWESKLASLTKIRPQPQRTSNVRLI